MASRRVPLPASARLVTVHVVGTVRSSSGVTLSLTETGRRIVRPEVFRRQPFSHVLMLTLLILDEGRSTRRRGRVLGAHRERLDPACTAGLVSCGYRLW